MIFWVLAAMLTAGITFALVTPLRRDNRVLGVLLTFAVPFLALILYFLRGAPDLLK